MYHITTETATQDGEFTDGDELNAIPPTDLNAFWFNMIQRELLNVLAGAGVTPDASNFAQVWDVLQKVGMKCLYSDSAVVDVSGFTGSTILFHSASNFSFSGSLKVGSLVVIIPMWSSESPDYISVVYNGITGVILKYNAFVGIYPSLSAPLSGVQIPVKRVSDNTLVSKVDASALSYSSLYCKSYETFSGVESLEYEGLYDYQVLQLKEFWTLGQIKKFVYVGDNEQMSIIVCYDTEGHYRNVFFSKKTYKEFMCVGFATVSGKEFAVLVTNGTDGL